MKRIVIAAIAALSILSVSGPASAAVPAYTDEELGFVASIRENTEVLAYAKKADIVELGNLTCAALRKGRSVKYMADSYVSTGLDPFEVGVVIGSAVSWLCPKYTKAVKRYIATLD